MTRPLEQIEPDLVAARQAHQEAVETARLAKELAADLRGRAITGDASVTALALAEAEASARFSELPIDAKFRAIADLEAEHVVAETERWADGVSATHPAIRGDVERAFATVEAGIDFLVAAAQLDTSYTNQTSAAVGRAVRADVSPRVRRTARGVVVDGMEMRPVPVHERLERLVQKAHERLFGGQPKVQF